MGPQEIVTCVSNQGQQPTTETTTEVSWLVVTLHIWMTYFLYHAQNLSLITVINSVSLSLTSPYYILIMPPSDFRVASEEFTFHAKL